MAHKSDFAALALRLDCTLSWAKDRQVALGCIVVANILTILMVGEALLGQSEQGGYQNTYYVGRDLWMSHREFPQPEWVINLPYLEDTMLLHGSYYCLHVLSLGPISCVHSEISLLLASLLFLLTGRRALS